MRTVPLTGVAEDAARGALPSCLYHGTRSSLLASIATHGLVGRAVSGRDNWEHTVPSRADAVYLTRAYALHYAQTCQAPGWPALLEIDVTALDTRRFGADEDGVAETTYSQGVSGSAATPEEATAHWRERIHEICPSRSLRSIGNCTYFDTITPSAIRRVLLLSPVQAMRLTMQACDPVVCVANFALFGAEYERFTRWLFDAQGPWEETRMPVQPPGFSAVSLEAGARMSAALEDDV
jgi:hypothetical protein